MPKYMCITTCLLSKKSPQGKPYQEMIPQGTIINSKELPNHHFVELEGEKRNMDLREILIDKLSKYEDVYVDENMDIIQLQGLLTEKRLEEAQKDDVALYKKVLDNHQIKYHHKLGAQRLLKLIRTNDLEKELTKERFIG